MMAKPTGNYRILSLDGGGVRGLLTALVLQRLEGRFPGMLARVDLYAGTSTGGILALALAAGIPPEQLISLYAGHAAFVFSDSRLDDLRDLGRLIGAEYAPGGLLKLLAGIFGSRRLGDLPTQVLVPAFDLDSPGRRGQPRGWKPKFFHNFPGPGSDAKERIVDVAMRTCAAPTLFPTYQGYIDGGVVANNPSMAALALALGRNGGGRKLDQIRLLSLGTGLNPAYIRGERLDWGLAQWARPLVALMMEGMMGIADYQCERLLGRRYHRLQPILPEPIAMDAAGKTDLLFRCGSGVRLQKTFAWLRREFL